ncbi:hypothetical protein FISHEDRAFT_58760 [Fistulina hepatica ATCC 64428]|uniref:Uncharacterized protein n=1 Tax=Fistulina hepatica ATCC 64428 TaxID=1128425 RepID=A0A0D7ACU0_9AGAR|nr:hypothetical protein FISHEDRAFT_58760 [Fistulina hepatica ATCC 64428]
MQTFVIVCIIILCLVVVLCAVITIVECYRRARVKDFERDGESGICQIPQPTLKPATSISSDKWVVFDEDHESLPTTLFPQLKNEAASKSFYSLENLKRSASGKSRATPYTDIPVRFEREKRAYKKTHRDQQENCQQLPASHGLPARPDAVYSQP